MDTEVSEKQEEKAKQMILVSNPCIIRKMVPLLIWTSDVGERLTAPKFNDIYIKIIQEESEIGSRHSKEDMDRKYFKFNTETKK